MADRRPRARRGARPTVIVIDEVQRLDPRAEAMEAVNLIAFRRRVIGNPELLDADFLRPDDGDR